MKIMLRLMGGVDLKASHILNLAIRHILDAYRGNGGKVHVL